MGKLNVRITVTSEQQKSNVLLEKCTLELILLVQGIQLSYLWSRTPIPRDEGLLYQSCANCGAHRCKAVLRNTGFAERALVAFAIWS